MKTYDSVYPGPCSQSLVSTPAVTSATVITTPALTSQEARRVIERMQQPAVLYADDNEDDIVLMQVGFKRATATASLHVVRNGEEAVHYLAGSGEYADRFRFPLPQLVLLDQEMPGKSGIEVLYWIRQHDDFCCMPVILFTRCMSKAYAIEAKTLGANSVVTKPIDFLGRMAFVASLVNYWLDFDDQPDSRVFEAEAA